MFSAENNATKRNLFGVSLSELFTTEPHHPEFEIPLFLATIILFIDSHGHVPGIFKIKADNDEVDFLIRQFENGDKVDLQNPHTAAGLLVSFLIFLPEPILFNSYSQYIDAARKSDIQALQKLVHYLPPPHYLLLRAILLLLHHLAVDERIDVGSSELSQIVTPLLLMGPVSAMEADMEEIITLGELFIAEYASILAPLRSEDYAKMHPISSQIPLQAPRVSPFLSSSPNQLAPFQKSKYEVNYEIKLASLAPQASDSRSSLSPPPRPNPNYVFTTPPASPPNKSHRRSTSPIRSSSPAPRTSPSNPLQKPDSLLVGIYGSDPELKYVQSNEKLRQLDVRFEEMVENMQEKRSLFLNQIDSIRKRMVLATPGLRWEPPPPRPASRTTAPSTPPRSTPSRAISTSPSPRTASPTPRTISPSPFTTPPHTPQPPSLLSTPPPLYTPPRTPSPSLRQPLQRRTSGTFSPMAPRSFSPSLQKLQTPGLLHLSSDLSSIELKEDKELSPTEIEQELQQTRNGSSLGGEERDLESLHNYYYGKMKDLYTEIQTLKSTVKALQKDTATARNDKQEMQEINKQKDERITQLEAENERLRNPDETSKFIVVKQPLPPERKAPTPPTAKRVVN